MICVGRTRVKICGITSVEDARCAVQAGADAIGLVFYPPSPRYVGVEQAQAICEALPAFVTTVALCVDMPAQQVQQLLQQVPVDVLQFHGSEAPDYCTRFARPFLKALRVSEALDINAEAERYGDASGILLDTYRPGVPGGTGERFDWQLIPAGLRARIILAGGLKPTNVAEAIAAVGPYAVDVSGGVESAPGVKDPAKLDAFFEQVKLADQLTP